MKISKKINRKNIARGIVAFSGITLLNAGVVMAAPVTNAIVSRGAVSYDVNGDGIADVIIDSADFHKLFDAITEVNQKWAFDNGLKNYRKAVNSYSDLVK
ncbi:MAG: hypothetical protein K6G84_01830 [Lachnospiraceae bacterium]|nr:hypothetical protein [Lachnospiraceae bacterium]